MDLNTLVGIVNIPWPGNCVASVQIRIAGQPSPVQGKGLLAIHRPGLLLRPALNETVATLFSYCKDYRDNLPWSQLVKQPEEVLLPPGKPWKALEFLLRQLDHLLCFRTEGKVILGEIMKAALPRYPLLVVVYAASSLCPSLKACSLLYTLCRSRGCLHPVKDTSWLGSLLAVFCDHTACAHLIEGLHLGRW